MSYISAPMVAHLWAHQSQDSARNGSNFYFEGKDIYSYGRHFRCASIETNQRGESVYLVTTRTYSTTTAKHMHMVRNAIPCGEQIFNTWREVSLSKGRLSESKYLEAAHYIVDQVERIGECLDAQRRSRSQDYRDEVKDHLLDIGCWVEFWGLDKRQKSTKGRWLMPVLEKLASANGKIRRQYWHVTGEGSVSNYNFSLTDKSQYQELFLDLLARNLFHASDSGEFEQQVSQLFIDRSGDELLWEHLEQRQEKQEEVNRRREEIRERRRAEQRERWQKENEERQRVACMTFEEKKGLWYSGELSNAWFSVPCGLEFNTLLRVRNGRIETSKGIRVEAEEAARLWRLVERFHQNETNFRHDMVHDANNNRWSINSYQNDILTAGCHRISYQEMYNAARQLGIAA